MAQASIRAITTVKKTTGAGVVTDVPILAAGVGLLFLQSKDIDFGEPSRDKYLDMLVFDIESLDAVPDLYVTLGWRNNLRSDVTWLTREQLNLDNPIIKPRLEARFFKVKIEDENPVAQWRLSKLEAYGRLMGQGRFE